VRKVLIIDDDASGTQLLATLLKLEGFEALPLEDWEDPVRDIERQQPDLVIMDVRLRGKNGFEILERARTHLNPDVAHTPVLMMSVDDHRVQSRQAGADGFIAKPFNLSALMESIRKIEEGRISNR
jgi:DNA-binding response OmpR family regulator